jgi:DNA-binding winged helix-turn-helix (wHTH) protein
MDPTSATSAAIAFRRFLVLPHRRELLADGQPVKLGGRAFDVLIALIGARGAIVTKDALMARVWPGRIVDENALQSQISALRTALGGDRDLVRTISGRGYQFIGEVRLAPDADNKSGADAVVTTHISAPTNLPEPLSELIGRDDEIRQILHLAAAHRLVTLIGPGGIGKTRIALALGRELLPHFVDGVWLAEFSALNDSGLVAATAAAALGLEPGDREISIQRVAQMLTGRRLLLVLDTCEHVIDAAAALAEAVLRAGSTVHIFATSREPLQVERDTLLKPAPGETASPAAMLTRLKGIGPESAAILWSEGLFRQFGNRRQVAAYAGLAPTPWKSGSIDHEQGVSKAGNPRLRTTMVELAWVSCRTSRAWRPACGSTTGSGALVAAVQDEHRRLGTQAPRRPVAVHHRRRRHRGSRDEAGAGDDLIPSARDLISPAGSRWPNRNGSWLQQPTLRMVSVPLSPSRRMRDVGAPQ